MALPLRIRIPKKSVMGKDPLQHRPGIHVERERDLYLQLLNLGRQEQLTPLLQEALGLIVELGDARQGYLELYDDEAAGEPRWWIAHGFSDDQVQYVRAALSTGIIAEALATGHTIA